MLRERPVAIVVTAILVATVVGCLKPAETRLPRAGGTPSYVCGECHGAIYREWQGSAHSSAFTREEFRVASRDHAEEDCLRCHVPRSLDTLTKTPVRDAHRAEGVNCESCHLSGDAYAAPTLFSSHANHGLLKQEALAKSDFCGQCHKAIFAQWQEARVHAGQRKTCQECHMPVVRRKTVSGSAWHLLHSRVDTRHHGFAMLKPEPGKPNVELVVSLDHVSGSEVAGHVTVTNVSAHHSLPSGEFGFRELAVITTLVDRYGIASVKQVDRFVAQKKRWLPYGEAQTLPFRFAAPPRDAAALQIQLVRSSYSGVEAVLAKFTRPLSASQVGTTTASATEK